MDGIQSNSARETDLDTGPRWLMPILSTWITGVFHSAGQTVLSLVIVFSQTCVNAFLQAEHDTSLRRIVATNLPPLSVRRICGSEARHLEYFARTWEENSPGV